jgi:hypothetical protein
MLYFCNLCKVVTMCVFNIHINTTIEVIDGPSNIFHLKTHWLFPLFKLQGKDFMTKYSSERMSMIKLLGDLKNFVLFT